MAKRFNFDEAITTDIKGAASDSYIDNIKMIKVTDIMQCIHQKNSTKKK